MTVDILVTPRGETPTPDCHELEPLRSLHMIRIMRK